ncbi:SPOSA6832_04710, partial [Sporobolomyces salmonicolor]
MARRYFRLSQSGALAYSFNPNSPIRDSIFVSLAFISASRKHRTLHIDGGNTVYHCKALTLADFDRWAVALKQFIGVASGRRTSEGAESFRGGAAPGALLSPGGSMAEHGGAVDLQAVFAAADKLNQTGDIDCLIRGQPIRELESVLLELRSQELHMSSPSQQLSTSPTSSSPMLSHDSRSASHSGGKFRFLGKRSNSHSSPSHLPNQTFHLREASGSGSTLGPPNSSVPPSRSASYSNGAPFIPIPSAISTPTNSGFPLPNGSNTGGSDNDYSDARPSPSAAPVSAVATAASPSSVLFQFSHALATLKASQDALTPADQTTAFNLGSPASSNSTLGSPPPVNGGPLYASRSANGSSGGFYPTHRSTPSRASSRASLGSFFSVEGGDEEYWHDAVPGEFVLEEDQDLDQTGSGSGSGSDSDSEEDEDEDEEAEGGSSGSEGADKGKGAGQTHRNRRSMIVEESEEYDEDEETDEEAMQAEETSHRRKSTKEDGVEALQEVERRTQLPAPVSGDEFSLLSVLRKNVGKDLSTISFPVTMNEPLSALQRLAEELEYSDLLHRAAASQDPIERLTLVAVWAVSGVAGNKYRSSRKPFNPLLGETYECIRPDKGFKFISEKVSHHPPILAFHGEASCKGWEVDGHIAPSQKFWGRSMEVFVSGEYTVKFTQTGETFSIRKPSSFVRNLVAGTKYLEVVGDLVVTCSSSAAQAIISFKEGSAWGGSSTRNKVEGRVVDEQGRVVVELVGRWDEHVDQKEGKNNFKRLWQIGEFPSNPERYYGFSAFATQLNESTPLESGLVAPTDSRLRPDQLAFEHGDVDEAERLKAHVEEKQRAKRKEGRQGSPMWFGKEGDERWVYGGKYFEAREAKSFEDPDIF